MGKAPHEEEAADDEEGHQIVMPFVFEEGLLHHIFLYSFLDTYRCKYLYGLPNDYLSAYRQTTVLTTTLIILINCFLPCTII